jgi:hypothetical protein
MTLENWNKITTYYLVTDEGNYRKILTTNRWEFQTTLYTAEGWDDVVDKSTIRKLEKLLKQVIQVENKELFDDCK